MKKKIVKKRKKNKEPKSRGYSQFRCEIELQWAWGAGEAHYICLAFAGCVGSTSEMHIRKRMGQGPKAQIQTHTRKGIHTYLSSHSDPNSPPQNLWSEHNASTAPAIASGGGIGQNASNLMSFKPSRCILTKSSTNSI